MIVWFSGTGNSRAVAECLAGHLGEPLLRIDASYAHSVRSIGQQERIIWVGPVYAWRIAPVVEQALRDMPAEAGAGAVHWLVATCGDDVGETPLYWRRCIAERGWQSGAVFSVPMPNTYVFLPGFDVDRPELVRAKLEAMPGRVASIGRAIAGGETDVDWVNPGSFPGLKSRVLCPPFRSRLMRPEGFKVSADRCVGCGSCARVCPLDNIRLVEPDRRPVWGSECAFCTACYQVCPVHAVSHGLWSRGKGQQMLRIEM